MQAPDLSRRAFLAGLGASIVARPALANTIGLDGISNGGIAGQLRGVVNPFDPAAIAIFNAFSTPPTAARRALINNFVTALKLAGVWPLLDVLYVFAAAAQQAALINWINPGTFNGTLSGSPTFAADRGFTGSGSPFVNSNFNPTTAPSPQFTQNSASMGGRALTSVANEIIGGYVMAANTNTQLFVTATPTLRIGINAAGVLTHDFTVSPATGLFSGSRTDANNTQAYQNGASLGTYSTASGAPNNDNLGFICGAGSFGASQIASGFIGGALTPAQHAALAAAELAYMHGVGAA